MTRNDENRTLHPGRKQNQALFGPGGNGDAFRLAGYRSSTDAPRFVRDYGLDAYEYEAGRGLSASEEMLRKIGQTAKNLGIHMSLHAPYFISLSGTDPEKRQKSVEYIRQSALAAAWLGADIIVIHAGSCAKISRTEAMKLARETLFSALTEIPDNGVAFGIETMGKIQQLGTLEEVLELCRMDPRLRPVVDFGHMNARALGTAFPDEESYLTVFEKIADTLGDTYARYLHCHFSRIAWSAGGEVRHLTFADREFGPEPGPFIRAVRRAGLCPTVISESAGTQAEDALAMKQMYDNYDNT